MLRISKLTDYAIVIMEALATQERGHLSASELAERTHISEPTVSKLLKVLTKEKLLQSQLGSRGGYSLIALPQKINLVQIITAIEGEIALTECNKNNNCCNLQKTCTISRNWQRISNAIRTALAEISLADMQYSVDETIIKVDLQAKLK